MVDTSGSMDGESLPQAQGALRLCLRHLREGDRFNIIAFENSFRTFAKEPVVFTQQHAGAGGPVGGRAARGRRHGAAGSR